MADAIERFEAIMFSTLLFRKLAQYRSVATMDRARYASRAGSYAWQYCLRNMSAEIGVSDTLHARPVTRGPAIRELDAADSLLGKGGGSGCTHRSSIGVVDGSRRAVLRDGCCVPR